MNTVWTLPDSTQTEGMLKSDPQTTKAWENQQSLPTRVAGVFKMT